VPFGAIREVLDKRRAFIGTRALGGPGGRGIDCKWIIAIDAQTRNAITDRACGKGRRLAARKTSERADCPLIVDDVHNHRRAVDGREHARRMKVALGRRPFAAPGCRNPRVAFCSTRHREPNGLRVLRC